ncbi:uncharacterized protein LOC119685987 [Teleopsis dalmanni]|uniref:uncharacterized protein LOC119685987 n=1 Tax=Teleopsis dalmanni TaxID=139649 RepID=UPI0018CF21E0|nr:uncharacterized protein LOC119685987 [Teleopsis dalmanni]
MFSLVLTIALGAALSFCADVHTDVIEKLCENIGGDRFVPSKDNCLTYVYCNGESSYIGECIEGTYFDENNQQCLLDADFECSSKSDKDIVYYTTPAPNVNGTYTTVHSIESPTGLSNAQRPTCKSNVDEYFPHPLHCEYYYKCMAGFLTIMRCSFEYSWDFEQNKCLPIADAKCLNKV